MEPIRVFISSVQKEFSEERAELRDYLRGDPLIRRFFDERRLCYCYSQKAGKGFRGWRRRENRFWLKIDDRIHWFCPACEDEGLIDGWQGLIWDMRRV